MRRIIEILISIVIFVVIVGGVLAYKYMPRTVPYEQCSEVYKRYAEVEGVRASFVKDFWLNDSVAVDVTLLEADSDEGWERLRGDFKIKNVPEGVTAIGQTVGIKQVSLKGLQDSSETHLCSYSWYKKSFCVYHVQDDSLKRLVVFLLYRTNIT